MLNYLIFFVLFFQNLPKAIVTDSNNTSPPFVYPQGGTYNINSFLVVSRDPQNSPEFPDETTRPEDGIGEGADEKDTSTVRIKVSDLPEQFINIRGKRENISDEYGNNVTVSKYLGLPFALPPINNFRFQRPALNILKTDFDALDEPPLCPQLSPRGRLLGQENCLYLNIYVPENMAPPANNDTIFDEQNLPAKLPVLVWFHGESAEKLTVYQHFGILESGNANELDPNVFLPNKIIVVTPQYRLGSLGFLSTVNEDLSGNMGIFDQLLALEWIQRFISAFGGDSRQITLMGQGGSAMTLGLLSTSELARGLFHRLILMSGSPLSPMAVDLNPKSTFAEIALQNSCPSFPTLRFVRCMQQKTVSQLVNADLQLTKGKKIGDAKIPLPIIQRNADGRFLPPIVSANPKKAFSTGNFEQVPLILGVSAAELGGFLPSLSAISAKEIPDDLLGSDNLLKNFVRSVVSREASLDPDMISELVTFEYFSGLNVTERPEQAVDLIEEMLSDYLFNIPAIQFAKLWSRFAPVYFYVFDYVPSTSSPGDQTGRQVFGPNQAIHGSTLNFLQTGHKGSAADRQVADPLQEFWVNFIYKGSPLNAGVDWPQFRENSRNHILFRESVRKGHNFRFRQDYFWNNLLGMMAHKDCSGRRRSSTNRNSVVHFRDPEDFLKYTSAISPRNKKVVSDVATST